MLETLILAVVVILLMFFLPGIVAHIVCWTKDGVDRLDHVGLHRGPRSIPPRKQFH